MDSFTLAEFAKNSENKEGASFTPSVQEAGIEQGALIVSSLYNTMLGEITRVIKSWDAEFSNILEAAGITPSSLSDYQLITAINKLINQSSGHLLGEVVTSLIPLTYSGVHLLDGSVISGDGVYEDFVTYMASLYSSQPTLFTTEANYQQAITDYGVCSKFVYDSVNNTVRLPKLYADGRYLIKSYNSGDAWYRIYSDGWCEQGNVNYVPSAWTTVNLAIPFLDANYNVVSGGYTAEGASSGVKYGNTVTKNHTTSTFDAWTSDDESFNAGHIAWIATGYVDITGYRVTPAYSYIVLATAVRTDIEVDIDEIVTDLNNKVNKSDLAEVQCVVESYSNGTDWYRVWSDGWCEQGGRISGGNQTVALLKEYTNTNYAINITQVSTGSTSAAYFGAGKITSLNTDSFVYVSAQTENPDFSWRAEGYIA